MKIIGISGTPGVGKTSVARRLADILDAYYIDLSQEVIEHRLYQYYDSERLSYVIDEDAVKSFIRDVYTKHRYVVVDSHYAELIPQDLVELIIVLRLNPRELIKRLEMKGWSRRKIAENVEAELLSVCTRNAIEELGEEYVVEVDTTNKSIDNIVTEIIDIIFGDKPCFLGHTIDWLERLSETELEYVLNYIERGYV